MVSEDYREQAEGLLQSSEEEDMRDVVGELLEDIDKLQAVVDTARKLDGKLRMGDYSRLSVEGLSAVDKLSNAIAALEGKESVK